MIPYTPQEISALNLEQAYKAFLVNVGKKEDEETYNQVRYGINIQFDINELNNGLIYLDENHGMFIHKYRPNKIHAKEMFTELEERETLLKEKLIESVDVPSIFSSIETKEQ